MKIERMGLLANTNKKEIIEALSGLVDYLPDEIELVGLEKTANLDPSRIGKVDSFTGCDVVLALGGDGTLLVAARLVDKEQIPLLGIKYRSLGFLAEDDPKKAVSDLLEGRYRIQDRLRLEVAIGSGKDEQRYTALNDVVVHGAGVSRVVHIETFIDDVLLGEYLADGVIVATPTGSTAYSLSANGPIVNPETVDVFIITPLYPHSLSVRPVLISSREELMIRIVERDQETMLTIDGQKTCSLRGGDHMILRKSPRPTKLVVTEGYNFYDLVRMKLKWGGVLRRR